MYHSPFFDFLFEQNQRTAWRALVGSGVPDLHMRDIEILLRAVALHELGDAYRPSMTSFLNRYSKQAKAYGEAELDELRSLLDWFFKAARDLTNAVFRTRSGFSVLLFESVFNGAVHSRSGPLDTRAIDPASVLALRDDQAYRDHTEVKTNDTVNVNGRLARGRALVHLV